MAKLSAPEKAKLAITPSWPILCVGLFLLALVIQNSDAVNLFFVRSYIYSAPGAQSGPAAGTTHVDTNHKQETSGAPPSELVDEPSNEVPVSTTGATPDESIPPQVRKKPSHTAEFVDTSPVVPTGAVKKLVELLRQAALKASGGQQVEFSPEDRKAWELKYPCRSRAELRSLYAERPHMKDVPVNRQWNLVFDEYEKLHRTCITRVGNLPEYFNSKNTTIGCNFLIAEPHFGLGNKLFHTSSVFMYAILTQRVLLIPESTYLPALMCEPFAGSSWRIDDSFHSVVKENRKPSENFFQQVDHDRTVARRAKGNLGTSLYASEMNDEWVGPEPRFWCNTEQRYMDSVTWLTLSGCTLFVHKLFAIDMFRESMEDLFPQKIVATYILRSVLLPSDQAWERILHVDEVYLEGADKQVGVQVRFFEDYEQQNEMINKRISQCLTENKILPDICPVRKGKRFTDPKFASCSTKLTAKDHEEPRVIKVLIASLFLGLHDHLNDIYLRHEMTTTKEAVGIIQLTHEKIQGDGLEVDVQALVEIISLSFSDVLLITPMSTFGGVTHAYGGLIPWFINFGPEEDNSIQCQKGKGIEPCYMGGSTHYECPYDEVGDTKISDVVPYLGDCLAIDVGYGYKHGMIPEGYGVQMIPENVKDQDFSID